MVKNNIEAGVKVKCREQGKTQAKLAEEIDTVGVRLTEPIWDHLK